MNQLRYQQPAAKTARTAAEESQHSTAQNLAEQTSALSATTAALDEERAGSGGEQERVCVAERQAAAATNGDIDALLTEVNELWYQKANILGGSLRWADVRYGVIISRVLSGLR